MDFLLVTVCALAPAGFAGIPAGGSPDGPDLAEVRRRIKDPAQVFPVFQELVAQGEYGTARNLLSPGASKILTPEVFFLTFASYEPPRRLVASLQVHQVDPASNRLRLCSRDFGVSRDFRIAKLMSIYVLDFTAEDIEFLKGRTLGWYRLQVRRADGWHYAYPPDWTYAPLARSCVCSK